MILLRLLSLPYLRKHFLRSMLTVTGIVLGVGVFVGMHTANSSVLAAFRQTVDRIAGSAQLQISAGESGFDEEILERVQSLREIRAAVPVIEAIADTGLPGQGSLLILAVDMTGDRSVREYDFDPGGEELMDDPLVFLAQPDSIIVSRQFAGRNGLRMNSIIPMRTLDGEKRFTVRGIMRPKGLAAAFGGNLAVMDIYSAQKVFGRGRKFDRIDLAVQEEASVDEVRRKLESMLGPGFQVESPSSRGQHFESLARAFSMSVNLTSAFALLIGMFIIYNSFAIAVVQRRAEIGILRALGATRAQVRNLFLGESLVAGLIGSAAGIAVGSAMARGISEQMSGMLGSIYGTSQHLEEVSSDPRLIALAAALGVLTSVFSAWAPARNAAAVDPVKALQKGRSQAMSAGESRMRWVAAIGLIVLSGGLLALIRGSPLLYVAYLATIAAALLLTPGLCLWLARLSRPILAAIRPVEGRLAADSLIQQSKRTSATIAALMLSLALAIGLAGIARSSYASIRNWVETALNPDLFVTASDSLTKRQFRLPISMQDELRLISGIDEVQPVRSVRILYRNRPVLLIALDVAALGRRARATIVAGDRDEMNRLAGSGSGVIAGENFARLEGIGYGDILDLPTPCGPLRMPVVGIVRDYSDQSGVLFVDRKVYRRCWNDDSVTAFRVYLKRTADPEEARRQILERTGKNRRVFVLTNREVREFVLRLTNQWFGLTWIQLIVAVLVAILGIVNTLTVSIVDRRRELAVLQAVGALRRQVRHTIWLEAMTIAAIGVVLGLALGAANLFFSLYLLTRDVAGLSLDYLYPWGVAGLLWPVMLAAAFIAALGPAESAVRASLVEALEYE